MDIIQFRGYLRLRLSCRGMQDEGGMDSGNSACAHGTRVADGACDAVGGHSARMRLPRCSPVSARLTWPSAAMRSISRIGSGGLTALLVAAGAGVLGGSLLALTVLARLLRLGIIASSSHVSSSLFVI